MKYAVEVAGKVFEVEIKEGRVLVDGRLFEGGLAGAAGAVVRRLTRGVNARVFQAHGAGTGAWRVTCDGQRVDAQVMDPRQSAVRTASGGREGKVGAGAVLAPMPGLVLRVLAAEGAAVEAGQGLVVLEAMKMENELKARGKGTVRKVHVKPGDRVQKGALLVELS